jgi:hypothetical protein
VFIDQNSLYCFNAKMFHALKPKIARRESWGGGENIDIVSGEGQKNVRALNSVPAASGKGHFERRYKSLGSEEGRAPGSGLYY